MAANGISQHLESQFAAIASSVGCELLHAEFKGGRLRLILDRPDGATLQDCETVSKQVSALLDVEEFGTARYTLEVSSPGLDRELYGPRDYERFVGRLVKVTWQTPEMEHKRTMVVRLEGFDPAGTGSVSVVDETKDETYSISLPDIRLARLEVEW